MNPVQQASQVLSPSSVAITPSALLLNLVLAAALASNLARLYVRWGTSLSNRTSFGDNFVLITTTTALIITIVKSSLALSLGLVGALSVVRFRAAIKEPEELSYLFLCIAIGLGFGADQTVPTLLAFLLIGTLIAIKGVKRGRSGSTENLFLTISQRDSKDVLQLDDVVRAVTENCAAASLRRFDEGSGTLEVAFLVEFTSYEQLDQTKRRLRALSESLQVSFVDQRGLF